MKNKIYLIANWKMQLLNSEAGELGLALKHESTRLLTPEGVADGGQVKTLKQKNIELVLCPSFTALSELGKKIPGDSSPDSRRGRNDIAFKLGAQNVFYHEKGAYTGEISPLQLKELGVTYVIIGHSERRTYLNESDTDTNLKIKTCLAHNLTPVLCVGETFDERRFGRTELVLIRQLTRGLEDIKLKNDQKLIIAYEPVWVIGTGQAINPLDAKNAALAIKQTLLDFFTIEEIENKISIIYGGSVDQNNILDFIEPGLLDGALVGTASLTTEKFIPLIETLAEKL